MSDQSFDFHPVSDGEDPVASAVFQALGAASMCWSETPRGVFDDQRARDIGEALLARLRSDEREEPVQISDDDAEPFRYVIEFESRDTLTTFSLPENEVPTVDIEHDIEGRGEPVWLVKIGGEVQAWVPERRMVAVFRLDGEEDDDGDGDDDSDPDPDGPNLDGLAVWTDDDGVTRWGTRDSSSIIGRRDELAERRAA